MEKWPNMFIVGASKAGTTSLYEYLKKIPGIYMSPIKEPDYFSSATVRANSKLKPIRSTKQYLKLFEKVKNEKIIGEATPRYLSDPEAARLIHQIIPHAKIVISLRNPVQRLYSFYFMEQSVGKFKLSFHEQLQKELRKEQILGPKLGMERSLYSEDVKRYLNIFGAKQVKIIIFEEFIKDPKSIFRDILKFLGINQSIENFENIAYNTYSVPRGPIAKLIVGNISLVKAVRKILPSSNRKFLKENILTKKLPKPKMNEEDKQALIKFYKSDVNELEILLERKLPWPEFDN